MTRTGTLTTILLTVAAVIMIVVGISTVTGGPKSVRGQVISVEQTSVTAFSSLVIEDDSGKKWTFQGAKTFSGFTPSHLEQHRALRESVTVEYEKSESGDLVILGFAD